VFRYLIKAEADSYVSKDFERELLLTGNELNRLGYSSPVNPKAGFLSVQDFPLPASRSPPLQHPPRSNIQHPTPFLTLTQVNKHKRKVILSSPLLHPTSPPPNYKKRPSSSDHLPRITPARSPRDDRRSRLG
jgi:hypothetical protein